MLWENCTIHVWLHHDNHTPSCRFVKYMNYFHVQSRKCYTGQEKIYTGTACGACDKYEVCIIADMYYWQSDFNLLTVPNIKQINSSQMLTCKVGRATSCQRWPVGLLLTQLLGPYSPNSLQNKTQAWGEEVKPIGQADRIKDAFLVNINTFHNVT